MSTTTGTFDPDTVELLRGVVQDIWNGFTASQQSVFSKDEIARLVMLLAETGVSDRDDLFEMALESLLRGE